MSTEHKSVNFSLNKIKTLSPIDAKTYITKYFVPLDNGNHAMLIDGTFQIKEDSEVKRAYFNRMQKELCNYYFKEYSEVRSVVYQVNKPLMFDDKINLCPPMKFEFDPEIKPTRKVADRLNFFLDFLKDVLCSGKEDCYHFLLKWLANLCKGNKNNSCLYLKGIQGTGKSSLFVFLSRHVLGTKLCLETGSDPIRTKFNEILGGKLLVCIEELENFSKSEWESISSTLKRMITSDNITLQNKCTKAFESNNINNYILCSNNDAIKDDDGRRYFILDISTHRVGDRAYYDKLYNECYNDDVGQAFFNFICNIDTNNFNPQSFPITQSKKDSLSKRLDNVYKYIKEDFILNNIDIDMSAQDLYDDFRMHGRYKLSKEDFHRKMAEAGFKRTKKNHLGAVKFWYDIPHEVLLKVGKSKMWLNDFDEFKPDTNMLVKEKVALIDPIDDDSVSETVETARKIIDTIQPLKKYKNIQIYDDYYFDEAA